MLKKIIIIAVNALCLIAFIVCIAVSASIRSPLRSQQAADAWAGQSGERFSQLTVFFPESQAFDEDAIRRLHTVLDDSLLGASLETTPGRTLYTDAWSAEAKVSIASERGTADAVAIAVGGDFFMFHPLYLRNGSYLSPNDIMKDRVVIDEELAWRLFGSIQLAGFELIINNSTFIIAGVVSRENDFASSKAYDYGAGLFMSFEALLDMTEGDAVISTYEIVMPNPITGFAKNILEEAIPEPGVYIIENSTRFSLSNLFSIVRSFGERSIRSDAIAYPYWENAARIAEDWLALLLVLSIFFLVFPVICAVIYGIKLIRYLLKHGKSAFRRLIKEKDRREYEKYKLEHGEDFDTYNANSIIREYNDEIY